MSAKISVFVICVKTMVYLLLYNLYDCTFKEGINLSISSSYFVEAVALYSERQLIQKIHNIHEKILLALTFANVSGKYWKLFHNSSKNSEVEYSEYLQVIASEN